MLKSRIFLLALLLCVQTAAVADQTRQLSRRERKDRIAGLAERYREFLLLVEPIMTSEERNIFLLMESDAQRDRFIEDFWRRRDPDPKTLFNEYREDYLRRSEEVKKLFQSIHTDRGRIYMVSGEPGERLELDRCDFVRPLEIWRYAQHHAMGRGATLVFYDRAPGANDFRLWYPIGAEREALAELLAPNAAAAVANRLPARCPADPVQAVFHGGVCPGGFVYRALLAQCPDGSIALAAVHNAATDRGGVVANRAFTPPQPRSEDPARVLRSSVIADPDAPKLQGEMSVRFTGRRGERTVAEIMVHLPSAQFKTASLAGVTTINVNATGETLKDGNLFESYQYRFDFPAGEQAVLLIVERHLYPGSYQARIKVVDTNSGAEGIFEAPLEVPRVDSPEMVALSPESTISTKVRILPPQPAEILVGFGRVETLVADSSIQSMDFYLDGKKVMTKRNAPFAANLDFGPVPRQRTIRAVGLNARNEVVDVDELIINAGADPFRLKIIAPRTGTRAKDRVRVEVEADLPVGKSLHELQIFVDDRLAATLHGPPYIQSVALPDSESIITVRAAATLTDPTVAAAEDLVFLNAPPFMEQIQVHLVELPVTALRDGQPVADLPRSAFHIFDKGKAISIERFEYVRDLPLSIGLAIDTSASMHQRLRHAQQAAADFFQNVLRPGDQAFVLAFDRHAQLLRTWSRDPSELTRALSSLRAEEMTALHDGVISALYQFQGIRGQRALVLISDGADTVSKFTFNQALEYAKRAGVPIYVIGIAISAITLDARPHLNQLAGETGGAVFYIDDASQLGAMYQQIEAELRSQYLLAFTPGSEVQPGGEWRELRVEIDGATAKTIRGYYP